MGARLVSAVYAMYPGLPHRAKHAAVLMALTALDDPHDDRPAGRYFAGPDPIADGLGFRRDEEGQHTRATLRIVGRVLAELYEAGVYEVASHGRNGWRAVYDLNLDPLKGAGRPKPKRQGVPSDQWKRRREEASPAVATGLQTGRDSRSQTGRSGPSSPVVAAGPRNHEEPPEEPRRGQGHPLTSPHQGATASATTTDDAYQAAQDTLSHLGPEQQQAALERANSEAPDLSTRDLVIRAATLAAPPVQNWTPAPTARPTGTPVPIADQHVAATLAIARHHAAQTTEDA